MIKIREPDRDYFMSNELYDYLKFFSLIALPGMLLGYWAITLALGEQINLIIGRTAVLMIFFFGVVLYFAGRSYKKSENRFDGTIDVVHNAIERRKIYTLNLNRDPTELDDQTELTFKVISPSIMFPPGENRD